MVNIDDCGTTGVGETDWLVYPNTGAGFGPAVRWPIPGADYLGTESVDTLASDVYCDPTFEQPAYATLDLDGDARPDLVVTDDCGTTGVGETDWLVYPNTGAGFGPAVPWPVPGADYLGTESVDTLTADVYCDPTFEQPAYATVDLDVDARPDLVVTDDCASTGVGETAWLVYPNTGAGFGPPARWAVPGADYLGTESVDTLSADVYCDPTFEQPAYDTVDLDGDGVPELVVVDDCANTGVGEETWLVAYAQPVCPGRP
ncbi:MAG: hypothetical protein R3F59_01445 [Myxococcota bacterium]